MVSDEALIPDKYTLILMSEMGVEDGKIGTRFPLGSSLLLKLNLKLWDLLGLLKSGKSISVVTK